MLRQRRADAYKWPAAGRCGGWIGYQYQKCIKKAEVVAYDDLGTEAIRRLEVENLPVIVVIDSTGDNLYLTAPDKYRR